MTSVNSLSSSLNSSESVRFIEHILNALSLESSVLSLYLDKRRGVQENTSMRSREVPRAQPEGTPETEQ